MTFGQVKSLLSEDVKLPLVHMVVLYNSFVTELSVSRHAAVCIQL